jgi:hypothetical protein
MRQAPTNQRTHKAVQDHASAWNSVRKKILDWGEGNLMLVNKCYTYVREFGNIRVTSGNIVTLYCGVWVLRWLLRGLRVKKGVLSRYL